jgi:2-C-methyl-D-erythritol 2,4-cyclodiphosphate synthase
MRIGFGHDSHPLTRGQRLMMGGVEIPYDKGLAGWSDADVLTHAVMDALLGAAALGDIGLHFPSGQAEYKGISSLLMLAKVAERLDKSGYKVGNIDVTVAADKPKLRPFIDDMRGNLSRVLGINIGRISIKASTNNGLDAVGRGEGITAYAVALIEVK